MKPENALGLVELTEQMDHFPSQMSVGAQQRGALREPLPSSRMFCFPDKWGERGSKVSR